MIQDAPSTDILVSQAPGGHWCSFRRAPDGSLRRLSSPRLPTRHSRAEAESDLRAYAYHKIVTAGPAEAAAWDAVYGRLVDTPTDVREERRASDA
jgi:hypothetical protein